MGIGTNLWVLECHANEFGLYSLGVINCLQGPGR